MRKQYLTPSLIATRIQLANMIAASIPVDGTTDDEARSNKFWGSSPFDEEDIKDEEQQSWF